MQNHTDEVFEAPSFQRLDCYIIAKEFARRVHVARIADAELRDQATRAAKSCFLTLCEGLPNRLQSMRGKYFTESNNSLAETLGAVDLAAAIGAMNASDAGAVAQLKHPPPHDAPEAALGRATEVIAPFFLPPCSSRPCGAPRATARWAGRARASGAALSDGGIRLARVAVVAQRRIEHR